MSPLTGIGAPLMILACVRHAFFPFLTRCPIGEGVTDYVGAVLAPPRVRPFAGRPSLQRRALSSRPEILNLLRRHLPPGAIFAPASRIGDSAMPLCFCHCLEPPVSRPFTGSAS